MRILKVLCLVLILLLPVNVWAFEDFTTYTEVDPNSDITVTSSKLDVDTMRRDALSYVRKDKGSGHFEDFEHLVTIPLTSVSADHMGLGHWVIANSSDTHVQRDDNNDGLSITSYRWPTATYRIFLKDHTNDGEDFYVTSINTTYYLTIERSSTTCTCKIYSDVSRETLLDTLTITCGTGTYQYIYGISSRENPSSGSRTATGYTENLDLQEAAPANPTSQGIIFGKR